MPKYKRKGAAGDGVFIWAGIYLFPENNCKLNHSYWRHTINQSAPLFPPRPSYCDRFCLNCELNANVLALGICILQKNSLFSDHLQPLKRL